MARETRAKEPTVKEMQRLIYQVNKRLYRLEKSGISETSSAYENALEIIRRGEKKQNKMRLTVSKNETALRRQYLKAQEIANAEDYGDLSKMELHRQIKAIHERERIRRLTDDTLSESDKSRKQTFSNKYHIDDVDYAVYNLFKTRKYQQLKESMGSDIVLNAIADAVNTGLGTSQLQTMLNEYVKASTDENNVLKADPVKLKNIAHKYALKYGLEE